MMTKSNLYGLCILALLTACTAPPLKPVNQPVFEQSKDSSYLFEQAEIKRQRWEELGDKTALVSASEYYQQGLNLRPDDVNFQRGYYLSLFSLATIDRINYLTLENYFKTMAPIIKKSVAAPARILYLKELEQDQNPDVLERYIKQGLEQQPFDDYLWYRYSELMSFEGQHRLAAAYAKKAYDLDNSRAYYQYQLANTLNDIAFSSACFYEQKPLLKQAVKYMLGASQLQPDVYQYAEGTSLQYARLKVFPVALIYAKKAYDINVNRLTTYRYMYALYYTKKYEEAKALADRLAQNLQKYWGHSALVEILLAQGDLTLAAEHAEILLANSDASGVEQLAWQWLQAMNDDGYLGTKIVSNDIFPPMLVDFIEHAELQKLETEGNSVCRDSVNYFVLAYKYWQQEDVQQSLEYLKKVKQSGVVFSTEYNIAMSLLNSGILQ